MRGSPSDHERRNLHAVLESCPVGAAVVAHGRLHFANAFFLENIPLAPGVEGLRVVFDNTQPYAGHAAPGGRNATLFWKSVDGGSERRMSLIAHMASYGGEDAFFLWLPDLAHSTQHVARDIPASGQAASQNGASPVRTKGRILLAEDNEINQQIATELLEQVGMEVEVASNGKEAVDLFLKKDFDLVLMDIQMPLMDGATATRIIRTSGKTGADAVPVLAMTAHAMDSDREKSLDMGMNEHLSKPIDPKVLYAALNAWLPENVRGAAGEAASALSFVLDSPCASAVPPEISGGTSAAQSVDPGKISRQDVLFDLKCFDVQAGLSNVAGNLELYLRLLNRFAEHYRASGRDLRDALGRMQHDASAHEEAVRLAHTAKGVAANLGARALAAVAGELESAMKKNVVQEEMLARYEMLLRDALDSIENLPKQDEAHTGWKTISADDKEHISAVLDALPALMQIDWYSAQQQLLALASVVEGTAAAACFRELTTALEEFDSEGVAEKGRHLLGAFSR